MLLVMTQLLEAFFIAIMLVLVTNPHLISAMTANQHIFSLFHFF